MKILLIILLSFILGNNGMNYIGEKEESDITISVGNTQVIYVFTETYSDPPDYVIDNWSGTGNPSFIVTTTQISITAIDTLGRTGHISIIEK